MKNLSRSIIRCGIILAAGEGKRLQPFVHRLRGDGLPKQYVNFLGTQSMLEHTFQRAEKLIPSEHLFTVVGQNHLRYREVWQQISNRPKGTVVVQPENKDTGPGLLLPLMHLYKRYPESIVAVFPSDHFILEEDLFMRHVDVACHLVEQDPSRLILLGMEPDDPEPEYGYILPGPELDHSAPSRLRNVQGFIEKPRPDVARELVQRGGLWNILVMVFKTSVLLELVNKVAPMFCCSFLRILEAIGTDRQAEVTGQVYRHMDQMNFSKDLLEVFSIYHGSRLCVLPVRNVFWSDWGTEQRILGTLQKMSRKTNHEEISGPNRHVGNAFSTACISREKFITR